MSDSLASKLFDIYPKRRKETGPKAVNSPQKDKLHPVGNKVDQQDPTIQTFEFANYLYYHPHDCAFFNTVVNGTEIHKYLDHPYWIHKCLNIG